jgi:hypothetical protein
MQQMKIFQSTVRRVPINAPIPKGWRILSRDEVYDYKEKLNNMLGQWSIVAFEDGKIDGYGYGNMISDDYGDECGEKFIITP